MCMPTRLSHSREMSLSRVAPMQETGKALAAFVVR